MLARDDGHDTEGEQRKIWAALTRPLASIRACEITDTDIAALIYVLQAEQERRRVGGSIIGSGINGEQSLAPDFAKPPPSGRL